MRKKRNLPLLIICLLLLAALVVSLFALRSAKGDVELLKTQVQELTYENDDLRNTNQMLRIQLDSMSLSGSTNTYIEEDYCSLLVDTWSVKDGMLSFDALAQLFLTAPTNFTARLELWRGDAVFSTQPVTLDETEAATVFESYLSASFSIPEIHDGEELQLWLMVESADGNTLFACAATWTMEDGQFAVIAG